MPEMATLLGKLSVVGAPRPPIRFPLEPLLRRSRDERTLAVVCRNLGVDCPEEPSILARQVLAAHQAREIAREVEILPLKGLDLAHRLYPSPALRDMGDVDLLVRRRALRDADAALRRLGYAPDRDLLRAAESDGRFLNAVVYAREDALPVHLHWRVSNASLPHFMYRVDEDEVWREARGGAMAPHHRVVALCEHALKHSFDALIHLTDIELAAREVDWPAAAGTARRWGLERALYYALVLLRDHLGVESPGLRVARVRGLGVEGRTFLAAARGRRWSGLSALGLLSMARGVRAKAKFVKEALAPPQGEQDGLESRSLGRRAWRAARMVWDGLTSRE